MPKEKNIVRGHWKSDFITTTMMIPVCDDNKNNISAGTDNFVHSFFYVRQECLIYQVLREL